MKAQMFHFLERCLEVGVPMRNAPHYLAVEFGISYVVARRVYHEWLVTR